MTVLQYELHFEQWFSLLLYYPNSFSQYLFPLLVFLLISFAFIFLNCEIVNGYLFCLFLNIQSTWIIMELKRLKYIDKVIHTIFKDHFKTALTDEIT